MNYGELMVGGLKLMVFGMGMVYIFLVIMIYVMKLLEKVLKPFANALEAPKAAPAAPAAPGNNGDAKVAAIAASVVAAKIGD